MRPWASRSCRHSTFPASSAPRQLKQMLPTPAPQPPRPQCHGVCCLDAALLQLQGRCSAQLHPCGCQECSRRVTGCSTLGPRCCQWHTPRLSPTSALMVPSAATSTAPNSLPNRNKFYSGAGAYANLLIGKQHYKQQRRRGGMGTSGMRRKTTLFFADFIVAKTNKMFSVVSKTVQNLGKRWLGQQKQQQRQVKGLGGSTTTRREKQRGAAGRGGSRGDSI